MKIFLIGAAGGVGNRLAAQLVERGDEATGMHRAAGQSERISATGASPIMGDLITDSVEELARKFAGHDAVVFSAGAHGTGMEQTALIDGDGLRKAAAAAQLAGVQRFILVSAFPESERGKNLGEGFEHYMRVKKSADVHLTHTPLDWVIVRPGLLSDDPGDGLVTVGLAIDYGVVRRDNVAAFIVATLTTPTLSRIIVELTDGRTPAADAALAIAALTSPQG